MDGLKYMHKLRIILSVSQFIIIIYLTIRSMNGLNQFDIGILRRVDTDPFDP